jgi:hypothetical protein
MEEYMGLKKNCLNGKKQKEEEEGEGTGKGGEMKELRRLEEEVQRQGKGINFGGKMKQGGVDRKERNICSNQNRRRTV